MSRALLLLIPAAALAAIAALRSRRGRPASGSPAPPPRASLTSSPAIYQTAPADLAPPVWTRLGSAEFAPLESTRGGGAILSYAQALAAAQANGAQLVTRDDMIALSDTARAAGPTIPAADLELPDAALRAQGAKPGDPAMRSKAWADRTSAKIAAARAAGRWDPGAAKAWVAGAAPGRARLMGIRSPSGAWVQDGLSDPHDRAWSDYLTRTILRRPASVA